MYCLHCFKEINDDSLYCQYCGTKVYPINNTNSGKHNESIDIKFILSSIGYFIDGNKSAGFVILNKNNVFEDVCTEDSQYFDSILVKKNGKWGLINPSTGIILCDFIYDKFKLLEDCDKDNGEIVVYSNGLCGEIDRDGNIILPIIYNEIGSCGRVKYQGLWGCVRNGEQIIPCEYIKLGGGENWGEYSKNELEPSQYKNGKWGVIDANGRIILEFEYDEIKVVYDFIYKIRKGDKWGCLCNSEFTPCDYSLEEIGKICDSYDM